MLTHREKLVFNLMKHSQPTGAWAYGVKSVIENPTVYRIRKMFREMLAQWDDHAENMVIMLGFDLPKLLNVKIYKPAELNEQLAKMNCIYRATEPVSWTWKGADWLGQAGYFQLADCAGTVYIDSQLNRYIRLANGQVFDCTNADLLGLKSSEKITLKAYLTGLID